MFRSILTLVGILISILSNAQTTVYVQNNTAYDYSVFITQSGNKTLNSGDWTILSSSINAWQTSTGILTFEADTIISIGDTVDFNAALVYNTDTVNLKIRFVDTLDLHASASANGFIHGWYNDNNFHEGQTAIDTINATVKYKLAGTGPDPSILFALQDNFTYTLNAADFANPNVINVMTYNVQLMPLLTSDFYERATFVPPEISPNQDVVVFQEVFSDSARTNYLTPSMELVGFNNYTTILNDTALPAITSSTNGGVIIYSKWPIEYEAEYKYENCSNISSWDCLSSKGVKYARINKLGKRYHIFGTHMEAGGSANDVLYRTEHYGEMAAFIKAQNIPDVEPVIITGDLNTSPKDGSEYDDIRDSLNPVIPHHTGYFESTFSYADTGKIIDHVWGSANYILPITSYNKVITFRSVDSIMWDIFDFSDHRTVVGRFEYPDISYNTIDTIICQGGAVSLSVNSNPVLPYQWYKNGVAISGATNSTYDILSAVSSDSGTYTCEVTQSLLLGNLTDPVTQWFYPSGQVTITKTITLPIGNIVYQDPCLVGMKDQKTVVAEIAVFPTVNNGAFFVHAGTSSDINLKLYNSLGQLIFETSVLNKDEIVVLPTHLKGTFFIYMQSEESLKVSKMVVY